MSLPFDLQAPPVASLPDGGNRPAWSVMIPTFNCASYLRQTLASVLAQDPGPERMQIEVMDDCSTKDDPEAVVREIGMGRVAFYRKPQNQGAIANFNTCIERSRGHLVHILHGDDYVLPGFYATLEQAAISHPDIAFFSTRTFFIDEHGVINGVTDRMPELEKGARAADGFFYSTPIQTAGVVIRRNFYEAHGGFMPSLVHTADCEMWSRAISMGGGFVTTDVLACYRIFAANDTGRLARTCENIRDSERLARIMEQRFPNFDPRRSLRVLCKKAHEQALRFQASGDREAAQASFAYWREKAPFPIRLRIWAKELADKFLG